MSAADKNLINIDLSKLCKSRTNKIVELFVKIVTYFGSTHTHTKLAENYLKVGVHCICKCPIFWAQLSSAICFMTFQDLLFEIFALSIVSSYRHYLWNVLSLDSNFPVENSFSLFFRCCLPFLFVESNYCSWKKRKHKI